MLDKSALDNRLDHIDQESAAKDFGYGALLGSLACCAGVGIGRIFSPPPRDFLAPLPFHAIALMGLSVGVFDAIWTLSSQILFKKLTKDQLTPFVREVFVSPLISLVATSIIAGVCGTCIDGPVTGLLCAAINVGMITASYTMKMTYVLFAMYMKGLAKHWADMDTAGKKEIGWQFVKGTGIGTLSFLSFCYCGHALSSDPKVTFWSTVKPEGVALWGLSVGLFDSLWELFDSILLKEDKENYDKALKSLFKDCIDNSFEQVGHYNRINKQHTVEQWGIHYIASPGLALVVTAVTARILGTCIGGDKLGEAYQLAPFIVVPLTYGARKTVAACHYVFMKVGGCVWGKAAEA